MPRFRHFSIDAVRARSARFSGETMMRARALDRPSRRLLLHLGLGLLALFLLCGSDCGGGGEGEDPTPPPTGGAIAWTDPIGVGNVTAEAGCNHGGGNLCRPDHTGIDIAASRGSYVSAAAEGTVRVADY